MVVVVVVALGVVAVYRSIGLSVCLSACLPAWLPACLSVCLSLSVCLPACLSVCLVSLQAWKRSNSARLPHFLNVTTPKTQQFYETSSSFERGNVKNAAIQRDFLNFCIWQHQNQSNSARLPLKMDTWVQSWRPRTNAFCDFSGLCL